MGVTPELRSGFVVSFRQTCIILPVVGVIPIILIVLLGSCSKSKSTRCGDTVCTEGYLCDPKHELCVLQEQLWYCVGLADGTPCTVQGEAGYHCDQEVCIPLPPCGNGRLDSGEECDDSDLNGQTCISQGYSGGELGCGADCLFDISACVGQCGNGIVGPGEECDDQNLYDRDGCSALCEVEPCWSCQGTPSICEHHDLDGDGYGVSCPLGEDCDDNAPGIVGPCQPNGCPQGWVHIPAGDFEMGCNSGELDDTCQLDEQPRHTVTLSAYCIQETEVTVGAYRPCKDAAWECTGTPDDTSTSPWCNWSSSAAGREGHPINCISWTYSRQYCQQWLGGDLPTEAEWEKAARGVYPDQRKYPWGGQEPTDCSLCNWDYSGVGDPYGCNDVTTGQGPATWEVGYLSSGAGDSPYGLKDMAGNVGEWVRDWYSSDFYDSCSSGCTDPLLNTNSAVRRRVLRGGSFGTSVARALRVVHRGMGNPTYRFPYAGFRCRRTP